MLQNTQAKIDEVEHYTIGVEHNARKDARMIAKIVNINRNILKYRNLPKHKVDAALKRVYDDWVGHYAKSESALTLKELELYKSIFQQECRIIKSHRDNEEQLAEQDNKF